MKTKYIFIGILAGFLSLAFVACDDNIDPLVEELEFERVFSPTGLSARIRNLTTIELTWIIRDDADHYIVEFSEDSLLFSSIVRTVEVLPDELPLQEIFDGETRYSARVKGVSATGVADSKWSVVTIKTDAENIYLPIQDGDIDATTATLRWAPNSDVTNFIINPGNTSRVITADEKTAGVAILDGLTGDTDYTVTLMKGTKQRGAISFTTLIDVGNATRVYPEDDLSVVIAAAADGDVLVLYPGNYTVFSGLIVINKSLTIRGLYPYDKPKVHVQFNIENAVEAVELIDLDMNGDGTLSDVARFNTAAVTYGKLKITGCNIHDFARSFVAASVASTIDSVSINNCVLTNILTSGGDFLDFRTTYLKSLSVTNSTFNNCAPGRDFVRMDAAAGYSGTGLNSNVLIDHCTLYGVSNTSDRILYVRFLTNTLTVKNTLIAATDGYYSNQANTSQPTCSNNNYFNAIGFYTDAYVTGAKIDISGNHTTLDPGFTDVATGNFKVTNQTLIDNSVGDPRWLQ
ncbi:MAG: DUF4957 domain-containing protein [Cyclobacteriaceae bacterium]|nr:DUF4957 domain-containing protein [Cyclobacteriaceae bacterium]